MNARNYGYSYKGNPLPPGTRVMDEWDRYDFNSRMYDRISIGRVLGSEMRQVVRNKKSKWVQSYIENVRFYKIEWTHGPKRGKITNISYLYLFENTIAERQEILDRWNANLSVLVRSTL